MKRAPVSVAVAVASCVVFAPSVGRRDRPDPAAIGALRAIVSAQLEYASGNGGYYDTLRCLSAPSCIPGSGDLRPFLEPTLASRMEVGGYRLEFHAGPPVVSDAGGPRSPSSVRRFAVLALPQEAAGPRRRAFCADDRGGHLSHR